MRRNTTASSEVIGFPPWARRRRREAKRSNSRPQAQPQYPPASRPRSTRPADCPVLQQSVACTLQAGQLCACPVPALGRRNVPVPARPGRLTTPRRRASGRLRRKRMKNEESKQLTASSCLIYLLSYSSDLTNECAEVHKHFERIRAWQRGTCMLSSKPTERAKTEGASRAIIKTNTLKEAIPGNDQGETRSC